MQPGFAASRVQGEPVVLQRVFAHLNHRAIGRGEAAGLALRQLFGLAAAPPRGFGPKKARLRKHVAHLAQIGGGFALVQIIQRIFQKRKVPLDGGELFARILLGHLGFAVFFIVALRVL